MSKFTKEELSWSFYDAANSAYILMVTAVIPIYVKTIGSGWGFADHQTTAHWGLIQSLGTFMVALSAPLLGAMADFMGRKKRFFIFFIIISIISLLGMAITDNYYLLLAVNLFAALGYAGANNFYDAFLIDVTSNERMDFISSFGYSLGYIGSCFPFIVSILLIILKPFGLTGSMPVKISLAITAAWWLIFSLPMIFNVHQKYGIDKKPERIFRESLTNVAAAFRKVIKDRKIGLFLLAYFFYIDGVDTIIKMATAFGTDVGIDQNQMILALLATQVVAFPAVLIAAKLIGRFSAKKIIMFCILVYGAICVYGYFLAKAWQFWVLAICVAMVQGTIQALSRSYYGKLIPKERNNEYFGFYNILGKYATILGPLLIAVFSALTGNSRNGILSLIILFIIGFYIFSKVPDIGVINKENN